MEDINDDEYVVESIVNRKFENGVWHYLVKWEGYSPTFNTWEPEINLINCEKVLKEFLSKIIKTPSQKTNITVKNKNTIPDKRKRVSNPIPKIPKLMPPTKPLNTSNRSTTNLNKTTIPNNQTNKSVNQNDINLLELGYKPMKILAAVKRPNTFYYLVKFDKIKDAQLVRDSYIEKACPLMVIQYFEDRIIFIE